MSSKWFRGLAVALFVMCNLSLNTQGQTAGSQKQTVNVQKQSPSVQGQTVSFQQQTVSAQKQTVNTQGQTASEQKQSLGEQKQTERAQKRIVVAYVGAGSDVMPDMSLMTHIDYAFGHVNETYDGVRISRPERLRAIVAEARKAEAPLASSQQADTQATSQQTTNQQTTSQQATSQQAKQATNQQATSQPAGKEQPAGSQHRVKICLSIGGWGSGRFSEMAWTEAGRKAFAKDCARVVEEFGLDGIDLDWEYPTSRAAGISSAPEDKRNFTLLMREIRAAIGPDKLLTLASSAGARYIDFQAILPVIDFVNVMSYDMGRPPRHNAALYQSRIAGFTADGAIKRHLEAGIPKEKIVMGMPFYGHGNRKEYPDYVDWKDHRPPMEGLHEVWDDEAKVPYYADADGRMVLGFDNPRSIAEKCKYVIEQDLLGGMYWEYCCDNASNELARTVAEILLGGH